MYNKNRNRPEGNCMSIETVRRAVEQVSDLLINGSLQDSGVLRVDGNSTVCAYVANVVLLTEPTRLVVRRQKDRLDCILKWRLSQLLDHLSIEWWREGVQVGSMQGVVSAFNRVNLAGSNRASLVPGRCARELVDQLRQTPSPLLSELHGSLGASLRRSASLPALLLPVPESKGGVSADLVRRCLLLPYEDRKVLVRDWRDATCEGGEDIQSLLVEMRALRPNQTRDLKKMLY